MRPVPFRLRAPLRRTLVLCLSIPPLLAWSSFAQTSQWQGRIIERDEVTYIENPAEPMAESLTVRPRELWRIGGETDREEEFFGFISDVTFDNEDRIYLLDMQLHEVKVFSPEGRFVRSLGREGEGPGEFRRPTGIFVRPDGTLGVLQMAPGRIAQIRPDGTPAADYPLPPPDGDMHILYSVGIDGEDLILAIGHNIYEPGKISSHRSLVRVNAASEICTRYTSGVRIRDMETRLVDETMWGNSFETNWTTGPQGRVYAGESWGDYVISSWAADGGDKRVVSRDLEPRRRSDGELEEVQELMQVFINHFPGAKPVISDYSPLIYAYAVRDDGSLWVINDYEMQELPDQVMGVFDVFDAEGRFFRQVTVLGAGNPENDAYIFHKERLYVLKGSLEAAVAREGGGADVGDAEDEPEPMSVICYELGYPLD